MEKKMVLEYKEISLDMENEEIFRIFYDDDNFTVVSNEEKIVIGYDCFINLKYRESLLHIDMDGNKSSISENPLLILKELFTRYKTETSLPFKFSGGAMGYFSFELAQILRGKDLSTLADTTKLPDMDMSFYRVYLIIDPETSKKYILSIDFADNRVNAVSRLEKFEKKLMYGMSMIRDEEIRLNDITTDEIMENSFNEKVKAFSLKNLDNVVTSTIFKTSYPYSPEEAFSRVVKNGEQGEYSVFMKDGDTRILSLSSELFLKRDKDIIQIESEYKRVKEDTCPIDLFYHFYPSITTCGSDIESSLSAILEIEKEKRGVFTGNMGYIDFGGSISLNIAVDTFLFKDNQIYLSVENELPAQGDIFSYTIEAVNELIEKLKVDN